VEHLDVVELRSGNGPVTTLGAIGAF